MVMYMVGYAVLKRMLEKISKSSLGSLLSGNRKFVTDSITVPADSKVHIGIVLPRGSGIHISNFVVPAMKVTFGGSTLKLRFLVYNNISGTQFSFSNLLTVRSKSNFTVTSVSRVRIGILDENSNLFSLTPAFSSLFNDDYYLSDTVFTTDDVSDDNYKVVVIELDNTGNSSDNDYDLYFDYDEL